MICMVEASHFAPGKHLREQGWALPVTVSLLSRSQLPGGCGAAVDLIPLSGWGKRGLAREDGFAPRQAADNDKDLQGFPTVQHLTWRIEFKGVC